jgi:hypothetical protein
MVRARHDVRDDLRFRGVRNGRFEHSNNRCGPGAQPDDLSKDGGIALEDRSPEAISEHRGARCLGSIVLRVEHAAEHGPKAHDVEVRSADDAGANDARFAEADHRKADGGEIAECVQRLDTRSKVVDFGNRERCILRPDATRRLSDVDQPILIAVHERPQEDAADDAEDRGVGADAQRQGQDDRYR